MDKPNVTVSTPGRICLFGEHQDYLGLPVIAAAISLRISIAARHTKEPKAILHLPDIDAQDMFPLEETRTYRNQRDYLRSSVSVLLREGFTFSRGIEADVHGTIPINSGTSSSSALVAAWIQTLALLSDQAKQLSDTRTATLAHRAEVIEFAEPGGMMDHFATACGGVIYLETGSPPSVTPMTPPLGAFVLGDSGQPKDTKHILARVKQGVLAIAERLQSEDPSFSLHHVGTEDITRYAALLAEEEHQLLDATIRNREITKHARELLMADRLDHHAVGNLLHRHQTLLRDPLRISTPKIDDMIQAAYDAGALGAKINGSGGGGCMFAYAPENPEAVMEALRPYGRAWIVGTDEGTRIEAE